MRSTLADAPLVVSTDGTAGPYITLTTGQLEPVVQALRAQGVTYDVDDDAVLLDGRPALVVIELGDDADVERVQGILDGLAATWRATRAGFKPSPASWQNKLVLKFPPSHSDELRRRIESAPPPGWVRRLEIEERMRKMRATRMRKKNTTKVESHCFSKEFNPTPGDVAVWLETRGVGELQVSTIIPLNGPMALSIDQYNGVLGDFEKTFIEPLMRGIKVRIFNYQSPSPTEPPLEDVLSYDSLRLLRSFSAAANKGTLHPLDLQRWRGFVARAHVEDVVVDTALLSDWLQGEGWPQSQRSTLIDEYKVGRSLLTVYDEERAER